MLYGNFEVFVSHMDSSQFECIYLSFIVSISYSLFLTKETTIWLYLFRNNTALLYEQLGMILMLFIQGTLRDDVGGLNILKR